MKWSTFAIAIGMSTVVSVLAAIVAIALNISYAGAVASYALWTSSLAVAMLFTGDHR